MTIARDGRNLVFLLGLPRSGTTLLSVLLDQHPRVTVPPEPWLMLAVDGFGQTPPRHPAASPLLGEAVEQFRRGIDADAALAGFAAELYTLKAAAAGAEMVVDKTPRYHLIIDRLLTLFPQARVLLLLRNPFAVAASFKTSWDFDVLADRGAGRRPFLYYDLACGFRRLLDLQARNDPRVHVVRYEDLVTGPAEGIRAIQAFLDLEEAIDPAAIDPGRAAARGFGDSALGDLKIFTTSTIHTDSLDAWRTTLDLPEMQALCDLWGPALLREAGYGDALGQAIDAGVVPADEDAVARTVAALRAEEEERWSDCRRTSRITPGADNLLRAVDLAYRDPEGTRKAPARLAELGTELERVTAEAAHRLELLEEAGTALADRDHRIGELAAEKERALQALAAEKDRAMAALAESLTAEKEQALRALADHLAAERQRALEGLAAEKDRAIAALADHLAAERQRALEGLAAEKDRAMAALAESLTAEKDRALAALGAILAERDATIADKNRSLDALFGQVATLEGRIGALRAFIDQLSGNRMIGGYMKIRGMQPPVADGTP